VESFFSQKPDSALQILDTLTLETLSEKEYAHYCLLKVSTRDLLFLYDSITDSLLKVAEDYYVGGNDKWFEAQTCEALSRIAFKEGKGEQIKLDWLLKAFQSIEQCKHIDKRFLYYFKNVESEQEWIDNYRYKIQLRLGMCYLYNGYYKEGLHYLKPVNAYFSEKQKYSGWFNSAFMLGDAYLALEKYDSCRLCFEDGLEAAQKLGQVENIAFYHYSMSQLYKHQFENQYYKDEQEGQQLLQKALGECHQGLALYEEPMFRYKDGLYCNLSKIHFQQGQYDSCIYYAEKQLDFMSTMRFEIVPNPENADIFQRLYKSYEALGNKEKSLEYADRYFEMLQTIESQPKAVEQVKSEFDKKKYLKILRQRVLLDCKALASMRHVIQRNIEKGLLPNYQDGAVELSKQFCTIGGIGMYEVMDLFGLIITDEIGNKSYSDEAVEFATEILDAMNEVKDSFECDFSFNIEMIPAENCAGVICQADNLLFEQNKYFIYSNQWIPLMEPCSIQEKCRLGSLFDEKCGGGCIAHINIENRFPNEDVAWDMLNYVAAHGVIYFAFTTKISVCQHKHAFIGTSTCPKCGEPIADTYARVVGFYTPISSYQRIRKNEFDKRRWMNVLEKDGIMQ